MTHEKEKINMKIQLEEECLQMEGKNSIWKKLLK